MGVRSYLRRFFRRVAAPPLADGFFDCPRGRLYASAFNPEWLVELQIEPAAIIDAGSYDGGDAWRLHQRFPACRVLAIEADPTRFGIVRDNLENTPVELLDVALCDSDAAIDWFEARIDGHIDAQGSMYRQTDLMNARHPQVKQQRDPISRPGRRLDTLCSERGIAQIDLLHMDIQGGEYSALVGLGDQRPSLIYLETMDGGWIGAGSVRDIEDWMRRSDYSLAINLGSDRLYVRSALLNGRGWRIDRR